MTEDSKATTMVEAIIDYIYEEGEGKVANYEVLGILEFVKLQLLEDFKEKELA